MGEGVSTYTFTYADRRHYRNKLRRCLDALHVLTDEDHFETEQTLTGLELELNLVSSDFEPAMRNDQVLLALAEESDDGPSLVQPELGRFNLELNLLPRPIEGDGFSEYENLLLGWLRHIDDHAAKSSTRLAMVGMLPTLRLEHAQLHHLSKGLRYRLLNDEILAARGEEINLDIDGVESLSAFNDSIAPESANTSVQFHIQCTPKQFPLYWNASQVVAAAQVAVGANSPFLFGSRLWDETRIVLFEQATDTRTCELRAQGVRPRTWFGECWIESVADLFEENLRYFSPLIPLLDDEDPLQVLRGGGVPSLSELRLHNGTIYRWNRPVYDISNGKPHLRVENRTLPAGPTAVDVCANMAFYYGLIAALASDDTPIWTKMPFRFAQENFRAAARYGLSARLSWPDVGEIPAATLVENLLLPRATEGLKLLGVSSQDRDRYLTIIANRCRTGVNGASWQTAWVQHFEDQGLSRANALNQMLRCYMTNAAENRPVHEWEMPT